MTKGILKAVPGPFPQAVRWSENNLIAVSSGPFVTVVSPDNLEGPRGYVQLQSDQVLPDLIDAETKQLHPALTHTVVTHLVRNGTKAMPPSVRCLDWSPAGCAPDGGCVIAVCSSDYRVQVFHSAASVPRAQWQLTIDLSIDLLEYMRVNRWLGTAMEQVELDPAAIPVNVSAQDFLPSMPVLAGMRQDRLQAQTPPRGQNASAASAQPKMRAAAVPQKARKPSSVPDSVPKKRGRPSNAELARRAALKAKGEATEPTVTTSAPSTAAVSTREAVVEPNPSSGTRVRRAAAVKGRQTLREVAAAHAESDPDEAAEPSRKRAKHASSASDEESDDSELEEEESEDEEFEQDDEASEEEAAAEEEEEESDDDEETDDEMEVEVKPRKPGRPKRAPVPQPRSKPPAFDEPVPGGVPERLRRQRAMDAMCLAWSPVLCEITSTPSGLQVDSRFALLAVGLKSGAVALWRFALPSKFSASGNKPGESGQAATLIGLLPAHNSWVTALAWTACKPCAAFQSSPSATAKDSLWLATGSCDGSVRVWWQTSDALAGETMPMPPLALRAEICGLDGSSVHVLSMLHAGCDQLWLAAGKGAGELLVWRADGKHGERSAGDAGDGAGSLCACSGSDTTAVRGVRTRVTAAHTQSIMGLAWGFDDGRRWLVTNSADCITQDWLLHTAASDAQAVRCAAGSHRTRLSRLSPPVYPSQSLRGQGPTVQPTRIRSSDLGMAVGLATSPNGVLLAAAYTLSAAYKARCDEMYELRQVLGLIYIYRIVPPKCDLAIQAPGFPLRDVDAPLAGPAGSAEHTLRVLGHALRGITSEGGRRKRCIVLWDIIATLQEAGEARFEAGLASIVERLESDYRLALARDDGDESGEQFYATMTRAAWCSLRLATALRQRFPEANLDSKPGPRDARAAGSQVTAPTGSSHSTAAASPTDSAIARNQFELQQLHVLRSLQAANRPGEATDDYTGLLLMADWVMKNLKPVPTLAITDTAKLYSMAGATPLPLNQEEEMSDVHVREQCPICQQPVLFSSVDFGCCGLPTTRVDGRHKVARCATTFKMCSSAHLWRCDNCTRLMQEPPLCEVDLLPTDSIIPLCYVCGIPLVSTRPHFLLAPRQA